MKEFYYMTTSKGRAGCGSFHWYHTMANTKAEIKRRYPSCFSTKVQRIYTAEEMMSHYTEKNMPKFSEN